MPFLETLTAWLTAPIRSRVAFEVAAAGAGAEGSGSASAPMPSAERARPVTALRAASLTSVYRALQIHGTAAAQLDIEAQGPGGLRLAVQPAIIRNPAADDDRGGLIEYTTISLFVDGNAFWHITPQADGRPSSVTAWNPAEVTVVEERTPLGRDRLTYHYRGRSYTADQIRHMHLMRFPGLARGLGPIAACSLTVAGALDARDYGARWLTSGSIPDGVLTTDQVITAEQGKAMRHIWYGRSVDGQPDPDRDPSDRLRILGQGMRYEPLLIKPSDAQFLETQHFSTREIARMFGVPPAMLMASVEGSSSTYQNVEQEWIGYTRFGLMAALREIENALSSLLPRSQRARFAVDGLARADRKSRYDAHKVGLEAGFLHVDEVRSAEGLPPRDDLPAPRATAPERTPDA